MRPPPAVRTPAEVVELLSLCGALPLRVALSLASPAVLEELAEQGQILVDTTAETRSATVAAGAADQPSAARRPLLVAALAEALATTETGPIAPAMALRLATLVDEAGGDVPELRLRGIRSAMLLGDLSAAIELATSGLRRRPSDQDLLTHLSSAHEGLGLHEAAAVVALGTDQQRQPHMLGRSLANHFMADATLGAAEPPSIEDPANELRANQVWIEAMRGEVATVADAVAEIVSDHRSSPQAVVWACVAGSVPAALQGRARVARALVQRARAVTAVHEERLTPFAGLQADLVEVLTLTRVGELEQAAAVAKRCYEAAGSGWLQTIWAGVAALPQREMGNYATAVAGLEEALAHMPGDPFGFLGWARSELAVCQAMIGVESEPGALGAPAEPESGGWFWAAVQRNAAWIEAAGGAVEPALARLEATCREAHRLGQYNSVVLAAVDLARFGRPRLAATRLVEIPPLDARLAQVGGQAVIALAEPTVDGLMAAHHGARSMSWEPVASELALMAMRTATRQGLVAERARLELCTNVRRLPTPLLGATPVDQVLTDRERQVARAAAGTATSKQIGAGLEISPRTVDNLLGRVYDKAQLGGRAELAALLNAVLAVLGTQVVGAPSTASTSLSSPLAPNRNVSGVAQPGPRMSSASCRYTAAWATVRIPPDGLRPTGTAAPRITSSMVCAASGVADTGLLPVDVLMKSAPAAMASSAAWPTVSWSGSSPVSRIALTWAGRAACFTASTISTTATLLPASRA